MNNLLRDIIIKSYGSPPLDEIRDVTINLQNGKPGDLVFYKIGKTSNDIKIFCERLNNTRASTICINKVDFEIPLEISKHCYIIVVDEGNFLAAQKIVLDKIYPITNRELKLVGVTGTNGKTSTVFLATQVAKLYKKNSIAVGTLGISDSSGNIRKLEEGTTTASYVTIRKIVYEYQNKVDIIFFEVSSHALSQQRLYDLKLVSAGWTSFSQDHLDYHGSMENYFQEKIKIFSLLLPDSFLFIPAKEVALVEKLKTSGGKAIKVAPLLDASRLAPVFQVDLFRSNLEVAASVTTAAFGITNYEKLYDGEFNLPPGRFNTYKKGSSLIVVDFAHTPDGLEKMLIAIKCGFPNHKIITLFGCGGDRDRKKRPIMGSIAQRESTDVIVTSDNTRTEEPQRIIEDILSGMSRLSQESITVIIDRREAIKQAINNLGDNEILLIAGRGHETVWDFNGRKIDFCDISAVEQQLGGIK